MDKEIFEAFKISLELQEPELFYALEKNYYDFFASDREWGLGYLLLMASTNPKIKKRLFAYLSGTNKTVQEWLVK